VAGTSSAGLGGEGGEKGFARPDAPAGMGWGLPARLAASPPAAVAGHGLGRLPVRSAA